MRKMFVTALAVTGSMVWLFTTGTLAAALLTPEDMGALYGGCKCWTASLGPITTCGESILCSEPSYRCVENSDCAGEASNVEDVWDCVKAPSGLNQGPIEYDCGPVYGCYCDETRHCGGDYDNIKRYWGKAHACSLLPCIP